MQSLASTEISRVLEAGLFRSLSAPDRERISAQATLRELQNGETVFAAGDAAEAFFVVLSGRCEIHGVRRGDSEPTLLRVAERGQTLGEDAILAIAPRRTTAIAQTRATLLELSVALLRRAVERSDQSSWLEAQARELQQTAVADAVRLSALARELPQSAVSALCESAMFERIERGAKLYGVGERANHCFIIGDGLVQLSSRDGSVLAYLRRGDLVADSEVSSRANYAESAVALESGYVVKIDAQSMRSLSVRYPADLERARRIGIGRRELQQAVVSKASESATQHGFRDLHRLETAKSLLAIDLDLCVRCGHCSWACASLHGITRLVRRGDKLVTALKLVTPSGAIARARKNFLLPSSCQHCKHPACMLECPTGAIGRGSDGEVFIREELCTGCGACAKACPWDNIRMAETAHASTNKETRDVAVKCDLCRGYEQSACVEACPTGALLRVEPSAMFSELRAVLRTPERVDTGRATQDAARDDGSLRIDAGIRKRELIVAGQTTAFPALVVVVAWLHAESAVDSSRGIGLLAGYVAASATVLSVLYSAFKRAVRKWMVPKRSASPSRKRAENVYESNSRTRAWLLAHVALGGTSALGVAAHAGFAVPPGGTGLLALCFWFVAASGALGFLFYVLIPPRLTRLEQSGLLPEDFALEQERLAERLHEQLSEQNPLLKLLGARVLAPYASSNLGAVGLAVSGRSLRDERARLQTTISRLLAGRGADKLSPLDACIATVVALRALKVRVALTKILRGWLVLHILASAIVLSLLVLHVVARFG